MPASRHCASLLSLAELPCTYNPLAIIYVTRPKKDWSLPYHPSTLPLRPEDRTQSTLYAIRTNP